MVSYDLRVLRVRLISNEEHLYAQVIGFCLWMIIVLSADHPYMVMYRIPYGGSRASSIWRTARLMLPLHRLTAESDTESGSVTEWLWTGESTPLLETAGSMDYLTTSYIHYLKLPVILSPALLAHFLPRKQEAMSSVHYWLLQSSGGYHTCSQCLFHCSPFP